MGLDRIWVSFKKPSRWAITGIFALIASSLSLNAQTATYTYTGNAYNSFWFSSPITCPINGSFTTSQALSPNLDYLHITPTSFSFSDCVSTISDATASTWNIQVSTDTNGNITAWYIILVGPASVAVVSEVTGDPNFNASSVSLYTWTVGDGESEAADEDWYGDGSENLLVWNINSPGVWSCSGTCQPSCVITSETSVPLPPPTSRTQIGDGEQVMLALSAADEDTTWELTGPGILDGQGEGPITYTGQGPGVATITASAGSCSEQSTIQFTVVEPSTLILQRLNGDGYWHHFNNPDIGFEANVYVGPDDVSFYNASFREVDVPFVATGIYQQNNGLGHCRSDASGYCAVIVGSDNVVPGLGTELQGTDCVYSGDPLTQDFGSNSGSESVTIPWQYVPWPTKSELPNFTTFINAYQTINYFNGAGTLTASKAGAYVRKNLDSPAGVRCSNLGGASKPDPELLSKTPLIDDAHQDLKKLQALFESLLSTHIPAQAKDETRLKDVTELWLSLFKQIDASCGTGLAPPEKPLLFDFPQSADALMDRQAEELNEGLLHRSMDYWHLRAIDVNATAAMRAFVRIHYGDLLRRAKLRALAASDGLSFVRIERLLANMSGSVCSIPESRRVQ